MKQFIVGTMVLALVSIISTTQTTGQPPFEVPLTFTDGQNTMTVQFGILPNADFCIVQSDSFNGHVEFLLPPSPPGLLDARFTWPRIGSSTSCFDLGSVTDFRPVRVGIQIDTFKVSAAPGAGAIMVFSWPAGLSSYFWDLTLRYFNGAENVNINMLTNTSVDVTNPDGFIVVRIFSRGLYGPSVVSTLPDMPDAYALYQNHPNPFNPSTRIGFSVPGTGYVSLKVFDLLGREVATLANEQLVPGDYERTFNAEGLTSGVYFYRLHAGGFVQTKKLLLLR